MVIQTMRKQYIYIIWHPTNNPSHLIIFNAKLYETVTRKVFSSVYIVAFIFTHDLYMYVCDSNPNGILCRESIYTIPTNRQNPIYVLYTVCYTCI